MTILDLVKGFAHDLSTGVILTDAFGDDRGPTIIYVNRALERLTGYDAAELVGRSPQILQGKATSPFAVRAMSSALRAGEPFHTCMTNYRQDGESYLCQIDIRPITNGRGEIEHYIAFEREVVRRRVRARPGQNTRFRALDAKTDVEAGGVLAATGCFASCFD